MIDSLVHYPRYALRTRPGGVLLAAEVALIASTVPARRATRVEPVVALPND